jgi:predicted amidohydrolase YtcJ
VRTASAAIAAVGLLVATVARADTLIENIDGISLDAKGTVTRFTGLLIGGDGRIVQVLARADKRPAKVDNRVDGKGHVALPGMIDSHVRLAQLGFAALALDLSDTRSLREVQLKVGAFAAAHPDRPWIVGSGWNHQLWERRELPTALDLDAVVTDRPVWLVSADGMVGWANAAALTAAGIKASGTLTRAQLTAMARLVPPPRPQDRDLALAGAQELLLARGITAVSDIGTTIEDWQSYRRAGDLGTLRLRIMAYAEGAEASALIAGPGPTPWLYDDRLRLGGVVLRLDGALAARGALLKAPYADDAKAGATSRLGHAELSEQIGRAVAGNFQVAVQANGDAAVARALDAIEAYPGEWRWRIEGGSVIDPADAARAGKAGVVVSVSPEQQPAERMIAEARLGPERIGRAFAWKSLADAGAALAFGSAAPERAPAPFAGIASAITREGADGQPFGGWQPEQRLTREAALAAVTAAGAWAGMAETRFGQLAPGQRADFVLLDRDPLLATPDELRATRVIETWVGGQRVYRAPELPLAIPRREEQAP